MISNLEKYQDDINVLADRGLELLEELQKIAVKDKIQVELPRQSGSKGSANASKTSPTPSFYLDYQTWYSEAKALIRQLLPDRLEDFVRHYEKPKGRKLITFENYRIEDALQGLNVTRGYAQEAVASLGSAVPHFLQQIAIVSAAKQRFTSSLFEIRKLLQADLFDSEIHSARELLKNGYIRAAGAMAGVIIEGHLIEVCSDHHVKLTKKNPSISDFIESLKGASVIDVAQWRFIQHLADIRNLCDHKKSTDPTSTQLSDLLDGTEKIIKTIH